MYNPWQHSQNSHSKGVQNRGNGNCPAKAVMCTCWKQEAENDNGDGILTDDYSLHSPLALSSIIAINFPFSHGDDCAAQGYFRYSSFHCCLWWLRYVVVTHLKFLRYDGLIPEFQLIWGFDIFCLKWVHTWLSISCYILRVTSLPHWVYGPKIYIFKLNDVVNLFWCQSWYDIHKI